MPIAARKNTVSENETPIDSTKYNQEIDNIYTVLNQVLKFYASATSPVDPQVNQTWLDTTTTPALLRRFDGTVWRWTGMYVGTTIPSNPIAGAVFIHETTGSISSYTGTAWLPLGAEGVVFDPTGTILTATDVDAAIKELIVDYQAAEAAKEEALGAASNAGTYMGQAQSAKTAAETAQSGAQTARTGAETAQGASETARDLAQKWASEAEDVEVSGGEYSAKHYAAKAAVSASIADHSVKASIGDASPGYLDAKVDGTSIEISGDKLSVKQTFLATTSAAGLVELATDAETQAGTDTGRVVTPASLKSAVPFKTTATMNLYVNSGAAYGSWGAGSDANAGTQAAPFATIAKAIAKIPKFLEHAVTINLAGEPNFYEWKPDGTNGIRFTTGDSGVTVAVEAGTTLAVALSGSAVTITLATGGSTIEQIIAAINASATVGPVISPIAVGTTSTNVTATLSAQSLTGGNVRTYDAAISIQGFQGSGGAITFGSLSIAGESADKRMGVRIVATGSSNGFYARNNSAPIAISNMHVLTTAAGSSWWGIYAHTNSASIDVTDVAVSGSWGQEIGGYKSKVDILRAGVFGAAIGAISARNLCQIVINGCFGAGNSVGLYTLGGDIKKLGVNSIGATTAESATPAGTIL